MVVDLIRLMSSNVIRILVCINTHCDSYTVMDTPDVTVLRI